MKCQRCTDDATSWAVREDELKRAREGGPKAPFYLTCDKHYPGDSHVSYWGRLGHHPTEGTIRHLKFKNWVQFTKFSDLARALRRG